MKALLLVLVLALAAGGAYYFHFKDHPIVWIHGPELAAGPAGANAPAQKKDFKDLCARLQDTMDRVPANLREGRQIPTYALDTRSKVAPYLRLHSEYSTVVAACDLIINADQAFADHQQKSGLVPANAAMSAAERVRANTPSSPAVYEAQQALWNNQRSQASSKVRQLLATLEDRRL